MRYASVTVQFLVLFMQKNAKKICFFAFFCVNRTRNSDRNAPLRSLVLRAEIDSFVSCFLQKKAAGRPVANEINSIDFCCVGGINDDGDCLDFDEAIYNYCSDNGSDNFQGCGCSPPSVYDYAGDCVDYYYPNILFDHLSSNCPKCALL